VSVGSRIRPQRITWEVAGPVSGVEIHDRRRIGRGQVPTRRDVRRRPLGWDSEDELDLADIGGKAGASTRGAILALQGQGGPSGGIPGGAG
jgi:hypothetical protein